MTKREKATEIAKTLEEIMETMNKYITELKKAGYPVCAGEINNIIAELRNLSLALKNYPQ